VLDKFKTKLEPARVRVAVGDAAAAAADAVVVAGLQGPRKGQVLYDKTRARTLLKHLEGAKEFTGAPKDAVLLRTLGRLPAPRLLVLGLGKASAATPGRLRDYAGRAAAKFRGKNVSRIAIDVPSSLSVSIDMAVEAMAEGALMALFDVEDFRSKRAGAPRGPREITFYLADRAALLPARRGLSRGRALARFSNAARLLCALPSNEKPPPVLAGYMADIGRSAGLKVNVFDEKELEKRGMNALLAVGRGSAHPPRMVVAEWKGGPRGEAPIVLVGKGITMDTGGISLKPTFGSYPMWHMKWDMTGSASVICAAACAASLRIARNIVAIACLAENMPSGTAYKPSDVVRAANGVSIEIVNSDAEGRVVLADGLSHAREFKPQAVIDVATLTGAILVALGARTSGLFTNSDDLAQRLVEASKRTQDSLWRMPLFEWYDELIESPIADWKNAGGTPAGSATAAKFLEKFVGRFPWAHLDIAGTAWTDRGKGEIKHPWQPKGTTGGATRLLVETLRAWTKPPRISAEQTPGAEPSSDDDDD
jgi:leucyl aminopeptidase